MKILSDGIEVSSRSYYYLLEWNEVNEWEYLCSEFGKSRLRDLTILEYRSLFCHATQMDSVLMIKNLIV